MTEALRLRPMHVSDIPAAVALERTALENGWDASAYERELRENRVARYVVLEREAGGRGEVIGFGGLWFQFDEAHIVTVAVAEAERRKGLGSLVVLALLDVALEGGMANATLEVRASNDAARELYRRFGFHEVGSRRAYYSDNGEDAIIMSTPPFHSRPLSERVEAIRARLADQLGPGVVPMRTPGEP